MSELNSHLMKHRFTMNSVFGDFNAQFGQDDLSEAVMEFIGRTLRHDLFNENGVVLKSLINLHLLRAVNTFSTSKIVKTT